MLENRGFDVFRGYRRNRWHKMGQDLVLSITTEERKTNSGDLIKVL